MPRRSSTWSRRPSTRSRSTVARSTRRRRTSTAGSSSTTWPRATPSWCVPTAPTAAPARACTASSTRSTTACTPTRQFEVADARRVFTNFDQPDLKGVFTFHVTAPASWVVVSNAADPRAAAGGRRRLGVALPGDQADVDVHHRGHRRRVPRGARRLRGQARRHPAGPLLPAVAGGVPRPRRGRQDHQAGLRVLRGSLRLPLPVRQVRPALRAGVQHGRDGERRRRDAARRVPPAQPPAALVLRVPLQRDPARDGAHVVRRPGHDEVVGRPLAQRVVRRVGLLPRRGGGHRVHRLVDRLRQRPQADGLPAGPDAQHAPDRGGQLRPARGRGQLRHDHLRQGRLGAQAAGGVGRPGPVPQGPAAVLQGPRVRQLRVRRPAVRAREVLRPRARGLGPGVAADGGRQHPRPRVRAGRRRHLQPARGPADGAGRLADAAPAPARHRAVRRGRRPAGPSYATWRRTSPAS